MGKPTHSQPDPPDGQHGLPLRGVTPRQVAHTIHGLHSRLVSLVYAYHAGQPVLVYTFEVAGKVETFPIVVAPEMLESISDLFPEAAALEQALGATGVIFRLRERR